MTDTDTIRRHGEIVDGAGGPKAMVAGHCVRVEDVVVWHEKLGMSPDEIVDAIPTITLADVHAALASYWDNREAIERQIAEGRAESEALRRRIDDGRLAEKLRRRRA
jgi:uncharacterized protein (DUF433 family)